MGEKNRGSRYGRIRMDSGQHGRIRVACAVLGFAAFLPVGLRLLDLMVLDY